jgi:hypothetical protein
MKKARYILDLNEVILREGGFTDNLSQSVCLSVEVLTELCDHVPYPTARMFSEDGIECMALRFGSPGWQSGRLRCILEFEPDEEIETIEVATVETPKIAAAHEDSALETLRKLADDPET